MEHTGSLSSLSKALAAAQAGLKNPVMDAKNPHFGNRYASLAAVRDAVYPVLAQHGLSVVQGLASENGQVVCTTMLLHDSGEWIRERFALPAGKGDAQAYGSAATYCRRYALMAMVGVVGDDDDDANTATPTPAKTPRAKGESKPVPPAPEDDGATAWVRAFLNAQSLQEAVELWESVTTDGGLTKMPRGAQDAIIAAKEAAKRRLSPGS